MNLAFRRPIEVGPSYESDRVILGKCPDRHIPLRPERRKPLCFFSLAADLPRILTTICTHIRRRALAGGSGARFAGGVKMYERRDARCGPWLLGWLELPCTLN